MKPLRVLLVDDDTALLQTLAEYLPATLTVVVETAASVPSAIARIEESGPFDVLVSDFHLPPHTAHDLEDHLRSSQILTPLILHSGFPKIDESKFHPKAYLGQVAKPNSRGLVNKILEAFPHAKNGR